MSDHYDVIIIGTGAGRRERWRTSWRRRVSASSCWSAAAGCPVRSKTGRRPTSSCTTGTSRPTPGTTRLEKPSSRRSTTSSAARPSSTARLSTGSARRTSGRFATTTASRPPGRSITRDLDPYYMRAEGALPGARRAWWGPHRTPRAEPTVPPALPHEPRIQRLARRSRQGGLPPVSRPPAALGWGTRANLPFQACIRCATCDGFPCLVHAKSDAEVPGCPPSAPEPEPSRS